VCSVTTETVVGMLLAVEADGFVGDVRRDVPRLITKLSWATRNTTARLNHLTWGTHTWPDFWFDVVRMLPPPYDTRSRQPGACR
jgi:hypothetical protein